MMRNNESNNISNIEEVLLVKISKFLQKKQPVKNSLTSSLCEKICELMTKHLIYDPNWPAFWCSLIWKNDEYLQIKVLDDSKLEINGMIWIKDKYGRDEINSILTPVSLFLEVQQLKQPEQPEESYLNYSISLFEQGINRHITPKGVFYEYCTSDNLPKPNAKYFASLIPTASYPHELISALEQIGDSGYKALKDLLSDIARDYELKLYDITELQNFADIILYFRDSSDTPTKLLALRLIEELAKADTYYERFIKPISSSEFQNYSKTDSSQSFLYSSYEIDNKEVSSQVLLESLSDSKIKISDCRRLMESFFKLKTQLDVEPAIKEIVPLLIEKFIDKNINYEDKWNVCYMLGQIGSQAEPVIPYLVEAFYNPRSLFSSETGQTLIVEAYPTNFEHSFSQEAIESGMQYNIVRCLEAINITTPEVINVLKKALTMKHIDAYYPSEYYEYDLCEAAAKALVRMGQAREVINIVKESTDEKFISAYQGAFYFWIYPKIDLTPVLLEAMLEPKTYKFAIETLILIGKRSITAISALMELLKKEKGEKLIQIIFCLGNIGEEASDAIPILAKMLSEVDLLVRIKAIEALGYIGEKSLPIILLALDPKSNKLDEVTICWLIKALENIGVTIPEVEENLHSWENHSDLRIRFLVKQALTKT